MHQSRNVSLGTVLLSLLSSTSLGGDQSINQIDGTSLEYRQYLFKRKNDYDYSGSEELKRCIEKRLHSDH
jgi:hypothetical protein